MTPPGNYSKLWSLKLSEGQLQSNFYPRPHPSVPGKAVIHHLKSSYFTVIPNRLRRNCKRCRKEYDIQANGLPSKPNEHCFYHPKMAFGKPPKYGCCRRGPKAAPCARAQQHVTVDIDPRNLIGFVTTKTNSRVTASNVYALDCEMVCTTAGLEVASISVVDSNCEVVFETMILPDNPILDYLTEHSGLCKSDFVGIATSLDDVHAKLLSLFGDRTILVGHGLCNDMLRLRLFHDNVVDTSVIYPHVKGNGVRYSLKSLKEKYLPYYVTKANTPKARGDAVAAMKLALLKSI